MTKPAAASPTPSNEVKFNQVAVRDPTVLAAPLILANLGAFLQSRWFQSLYRSSDKGEHWMFLNSVNSPTDIVAFVVWDAKKQFLSAPAGLQAVVELFYVKGSTLHYSVLSTPVRKLELKRGSERDVRDYLQKTVIGARFGPADAARLTLTRLETVQDNGRALLKVWGTQRLRPTIFLSHDPGEFEREAMVFVLEEKDGILEIEAFCLNVLAQEVFIRLVRKIQRLRTSVSSIPPPTLVATEESSLSGDLEPLAAGSTMKRTQTTPPAERMPELVPVSTLKAGKPPAGKYATEPEDDRLKSIEPERDRSIIAAWNAGKSAKEIGLKYSLSEKTVNNICSKWRTKVPGLVRAHGE